jgi:hypothetical protein
MIVLRRYLALIALFFWQGGFTFYASVVVPLGQQVFGPLRQGFLTRQVTVYLNLAGALALLVLLWDLLAAREPSRRRWWGRWLLWTSMLLTLSWLFQLHGQLEELLVVKGRIILDADSFHMRHRLYLWISTVQWACGLLYLVTSLGVWRQEDRLGKEVEESQGAKKVPPLAPSASPSHRSSHTAEQRS